MDMCWMRVEQQKQRENKRRIVASSGLAWPDCTIASISNHRMFHSPSMHTELGIPRISAVDNHGARIIRFYYRSYRSLSHCC
jgi:hypothetical protein